MKQQEREFAHAHAHAHAHNHYKMSLQNPLSFVFEFDFSVHVDSLSSFFYYIFIFSCHFSSRDRSELVNQSRFLLNKSGRFSESNEDTYEIYSIVLTIQTKKQK